MQDKIDAFREASEIEARKYRIHVGGRETYVTHEREPAIRYPFSSFELASRYVRNNSIAAGLAAVERL